MTERRAPAQLTLEDAGLAGAAFTTEVAGTGRFAPDVVTPGPAAVGGKAPKVRRLWVNNFKGFEDFELTLGEFNVLAGANNSGKSTLLQAADLVFRLIDLHREGAGLATGRNVAPAILPVAQLRDLWFGQRYRAANRFVPAVLGVEFDGGGVIEFGIIGPFGAATSKVLQSRGIDEAALDLMAARPAVWVPSSVGIVRDEEFRPAARRVGLIFAGRHNEVLRNLLLDLQRRAGAFEELQRLLDTYLGGRLGDVHFNEDLDQFVTVTYARDDVQHDLYSVGAGFLQVLQLLSFILSRDPGLVLLDEPDAHLHSSLQRTVVDVLDELSRARGMQIVLSTHSKEIINYVDPSRLILIEQGAASASASTEAVTQLTILQSLGEIDNVDAYALVKNRRCLFVEGSTDVLIDARVLTRLIATASAERGGNAAPTSFEVEALIIEESDRLKDVSVDRAAERYSRDRHRATRAFPAIPEANRVAREFVDAHWASVEERLKVAPGKRLLAAIRSRLKAEFDVSFGNPRLVEEFAADEIPADIVELLREAVAITGTRPPARRANEA